MGNGTGAGKAYHKNDTKLEDNVWKPDRDNSSSKPLYK